MTKLLVYASLADAGIGAREASLGADRRLSSCLYSLPGLTFGVKIRVIFRFWKSVDCFWAEIAQIQNSVFTGEAKLLQVINLS
jgi:hypothetical protein